MKFELEDDFTDVIAKSMFGQSINESQLSRSLDISEKDIENNKMSHDVLEKVSDLLNLSSKKLKGLVDSSKEIDLVNGAIIYPPSIQNIILPKWLYVFRSDFYVSYVNNYLIVDHSNNGIIFDTGTNISELIDFVIKNDINITDIFITHLHGDHVGKLDELLEKLPNSEKIIINSPKDEYLDGSIAVSDGETISKGEFMISMKSTRGHTKGAISYIVKHKDFPTDKIAIVGDAIFCCSIGRPNISLNDALFDLEKNIFTLPENTVICPGHGPITDVLTEKNYNPFFKY